MGLTWVLAVALSAWSCSRMPGGAPVLIVRNRTGQPAALAPGQIVKACSDATFTADEARRAASLQAEDLFLDTQLAPGVALIPLDAQTVDEAVADPPWTVVVTQRGTVYSPDADAVVPPCGGFVDGPASSLWTLGSTSQQRRERRQG